VGWVYFKGSATPAPQELGRSPILGVPFHLTQNYQIWRDLVLMGRPRPRLKGVEPQRSPILRFFTIYAYTPLTQNDHVRQADTCREGMGVFLGVIHVSHPRGRSHRTPQFLAVLLFLMPPFDIERPHWMYGPEEGVVLSQPRLYLKGAWT